MNLFTLMSLLAVSTTGAFEVDCSDSIITEYAPANCEGTATNVTALSTLNYNTC